MSRVEINELDGLLDVILILLMALMILLTFHYGEEKDTTIASKNDNIAEEKIVEVHIYASKNLEKVHFPDGTQKEMTPEEVIKLKDSLLLVNPAIKTRVFLHNPPHAPGRVVVYEF